MTENANTKFKKSAALYNLLSRADGQALDTAAIAEGMNAAGFTCDRRKLPEEVEALNNLFYSCAMGSDEGFSATSADNVILTSRGAHNARIYSFNKTSPYLTAGGPSSLTLPELRFLCDATFSADFMPKDMAKELYGKLKNMADTEDRICLERYSRYGNGRHHSNDEVMHSTECICRAIAAGKKVSFDYFILDDKCQRSYYGERRVLNPYGLVFNDGYYYLCGYSEKHHGNRTYRLDRMTGTEIEEEDIIRTNGRLEFLSRDTKYLLTGNSMWSGKNKQVILRVHESLLGDIYDMFGESVEITPDDPGFYTVNVRVTTSEVFLNWVALFGANMKIISPDSTKTEMREFLERALKNYPKEKDE